MEIKQKHPKFTIQINNKEKLIEIELFSGIYTGFYISFYDEKLIKVVYYDFEIKSDLSQHVKNICDYKILGKPAEDIIMTLFLHCLRGEVIDQWEIRNNKTKYWLRKYFKEEYKM